MRSVAVGTTILCLTVPAMGQMRPDDAAAAHGWPSRGGDAAIEGERWYAKVAASFGDCILARNPVEAQRVAEAASHRAKVQRSPMLTGTIKACLAEHARAAQFSTAQQNSAIYRAVLRSGGRRAPS